MTDTEYDDLMRKIETLRQTIAQNTGAENELLKQAEEKFGVKTLKELKAMIETTQAKADRYEQKAGIRYKNLLAKWKDVLK